MGRSAHRTKHGKPKKEWLLTCDMETCGPG
jgi:hypothetical protein